MRRRTAHTPVSDRVTGSRYGQKGTMGAAYDPMDMPVSEETGIIPDICINPHCLPSRMTIGHILESIMGKNAALSGELADGTPFSMSDDLQDSTDYDVINRRLGEELASYGFRCDGTETYLDGRTGKRMEMRVFVGPMSYQKLRHMVMDKYHGRPRGPVQMQTGQPVEGRHRDGGQRFGEMERGKAWRWAGVVVCLSVFCYPLADSPMLRVRVTDCLLGHGATNFLVERLMHSSDQASVPVCGKCGIIAQPPKRNAGNALFAASVHSDKPFCHNCLSHDTVRMCDMPFAYKLSTQEIAALHLNAGFEFGEQDGLGQ